MNKHRKTVIDTENKQVVASGEELGGRIEIGERDKDVQNSSCKINESWVRNVQCGKYCQTLCNIFEWQHIVTRLILTISLKCIEILNYYVVQQELTVS